MPSWLDRFAAALSGRYQLDREIGSGGMASVYLAQDLRHHRSVAIKVLRPDIAHGLGPERFLREIAIVAPLVHPHIVSLLDSGDAADTLYYVMPYLPGESLRARVTREGELPVADTIRIIRGVLAALEYAHGLGIVHRDIKPENILLAGQEPLVADFGIARAMAKASNESRLTGTGIAVGTTAYMAPEQASGDPNVDHRADLYSLGLLWYEMLAGAHPFAGLSPQQQMAAHFARDIAPLRTLRPSVPEPIAELVSRCLEKRPADRSQHAGDVLRELDAFLSGSSGGAALHTQPASRLRSFPLTEEHLGRLTDGFDPRMPGDAIRYLDNGRISDVLVCFLSAWCIDAEDGAEFLQRTKYRAVAPALFGFEAERRYRAALPVDDHLVLLGALLEALTASTDARRVIVVGFSTGADLALRLAAAAPPRVQARIDGVLALGGNLAHETAFVSAVLSRMGEGNENDALPFIRRVSESQSTLQDWLDVNGYLVRLVRRFRADFGILRDFARGIAGPFESGPLAPFAEWYGEASRRGRLLRCVFEDNAVYRDLVRQLQTGPKEGRLLSDTYQAGSIVIEPGASHFDIADAECVDRHVEVLLERFNTAG